jgi:hypothetical protein
MAGYNPLGSGNAQMDAMFAQFAMPMLSQMMGGQFIPQQFPAQNVMDQMVASKYLQSSRMAEISARQRGTDLMFQQFQGIRNRTTNTPLSPMGARQLNNFAGTVNSEFGMMMSEMMFGPQNTEDFFFGRKGDPVQLQRAVNQIGFYRPDAVTGADQMSGETLKEFSNQIYSNLYGPDANLNDISGLSAGRTGTMMADLARRGLLPQSMSKMSRAQRAQELGYNAGSNSFADASINKVMGEMSPELRQAFATNSPLADIEKLAGGGDAIRKIDATRVTNSLKGYSEAVKSVRQIFGDNGMSNAPMGQLIAAMEALTQNSMSSMSPGKIENLMRRTQMASRDSGVSLEALMGLSARSGAVAQQYGLTPELAARGVVTAMEHGQALRDTGGLAPGFGRVDGDKSMLFATDANLRAADSTVGRYTGALIRAADELGVDKNSSTGKLVAALKKGDTTYFDGNKTVNIAEEFGRNPDALFATHFNAIGASRSYVNALTSDPNTQEFLIDLDPSLRMAAQGFEYKQHIGAAFAGNGGIRDRATGKGMSDAQAMALEQVIAKGYGNAVVDDVNTATMSPEKRVDALYSSMRGSFIEYARSQGKEGQAAIDEADKLMFGANGLFGNEKEARSFLSEEYARTNSVLSGLGTTTSMVQQQYNSRVTTERAVRAAKNNTRAGLKINLGDGSNFLQRFSDAIAGKPTGKTFFEAILGSIDSVELNDQLMSGLADSRPAIEADFGAMSDEYSAATIDSDDERTALAKKALGSQAGFEEFAQLADLSGNDEFKDKQLVTTAALKQRIGNFAADKNNSAALADVYVAAIGGSKAEAEKLFANPASAEAQKAIAELASSAGFRKGGGEALGLIGHSDATETEAASFIYNQNARIYARELDDASVKRIEAIGLLGQQLGEGRVSGNTLLGRYGVENKELGEKLNAFMSGTGNEDDLNNMLIDVDGGENIKGMAQFSRNVNAMGGFERMGAAGHAGRVTSASRLAALEKNKKLLHKDSAVAKAIDDKQAGKELSEEQQKTLREATAGSEEEFNKRVHDDLVDITAGDKTDSKNAIAKDAAAAENATKAVGGEVGGILGQLTSGLASAMSDVFKDVKIENVTITNFKLPEGFGKELASGAVSAAAAMFTGSASAGPVAEAVSGTKDGLKVVAQSMNLTGTVKLDGVDKLIMQLQGDTDSTDVPNGPPVATSAGRA